jgi:hypothetical protein
MVLQQISTQDEFLTMFDSLSSQRSPLVLTKAHQGIMLSQEVKPVVVDNHRVVFEVNDPHICAALEGCVQLHCPSFSRPVKARVKDLSINKGMFSLCGFSYMQADWKERLHERVQPEKPTYVTLRYKEMDIRASLVDLSIKGIGLLVGMSDDSEWEFKINCCAVIDFQINPAFRWTKLGGAIHYHQKATESMVRLGIRLYPKEEQARQLEKYIAKRKAEIMEELDQTCLAASIPSGVECQFF